jgi:phosphoserine phosphatase RsbU/P
LCVPLLVDAAVTGFLYLDERGGGPPREIAPDAAEFALGLARLAALAKANLSRLDLFRRQAQMEAELTAAGHAQRLILPAREGRHGKFSYVGESRPGRWVGGDFFDVIPLDDGRLAMTLGDVSGKGIPASVLMTVAQGYLHAAITQSGDPSKVVTSLNRFLSARRSGERFLTLWVGILDPRSGILEYVDGGHGYAFLLQPDGKVVQLNPDGGPIIGIDTESVYPVSRATIGTGSRVVVVSDGLVEQPALGRGSEKDDRFGVERLLSASGAVMVGGDVVEHLFAAVDAHASGAALADDATALCVTMSDASRM